MDVQLAKTRRLAALEKTNSDRMLVAPAKNFSEIKLPNEGSVAAHIIDALGEGWTVEKFSAETQWSKSRLMINLYQVAKKTGIGIQRRSKRLHLVLPEGGRDTLPNQGGMVIN